MGWTAEGLLLAYSQQINTATRLHSLGIKNVIGIEIAKFVQRQRGIYFKDWSITFNL